jgi:hypothetical protein
MDHETSPLFDAKMPKVKPIAKLMDTPYENHQQQIRTLRLSTSPKDVALLYWW